MSNRAYYSEANCVAGPVQVGLWPQKRNIKKYNAVVDIRYHGHKLIGLNHCKIQLGN